jgi:hypothetical protein
MSVGFDNLKLFGQFLCHHQYLKSYAGDPPGSRYVNDSFTTSSRYVHDKKSQPVDQLQFCPRHVHDRFSTHDSFVTRSNMWTRIGSVAGDLANLRPECRHLANLRPECRHVIFTSMMLKCRQNLLMTSKQSRLCWRRIFSVDHLQRHVITSWLDRDTFTTVSRTSRKLVGNPVDHPH